MRRKRIVSAAAICLHLHTNPSILVSDRSLFCRLTRTALNQTLFSKTVRASIAKPDKERKQHALISVIIRIQGKFHRKNYSIRLDAIGNF